VTVLILKSKKKSKAKTRLASKARTRTKTKTHARPKPEKFLLDKAEKVVQPSLTLNTSAKTCQEVEVGDIGGFGSPDELEEHERRCIEQATEFCTNCGRNLCRNHYELIHRDHDHTSGHTIGQSLI